MRSRLAILVGCLLLVTAGVLAHGRSSFTSVARAVPVVNRGSLIIRRTPDKTQPKPTHGTLAAGSRLTLARLEVNAPVTPVGVTDQVMDVPRDPAAPPEPRSSSGTSITPGSAERCRHCPLRAPAIG